MYWWTRWTEFLIWLKSFFLWSERILQSFKKIVVIFLRCKFQRWIIYFFYNFSFLFFYYISFFIFSYPTHRLEITSFYLFNPLVFFLVIWFTFCMTWDISTLQVADRLKLYLICTPVLYQFPSPIRFSVFIFFVQLVKTLTCSFSFRDLWMYSAAIFH